MKKTASHTQVDNNIQNLQSQNNKQQDEQEPQRFEKEHKDRTVVELALKSESKFDLHAQQNTSIKEAVSKNLEQYFLDLGDQSPNQLYQLVINEVEPALLKTVLEYTRGNQSKAAQVLGLNRGTLRKKLKQYGIE